MTNNFVNVSEALGYYRRSFTRTMATMRLPCLCLLLLAAGCGGDRLSTSRVSPPVSAKAVTNPAPITKPSSMTSASTVPDKPPEALSEPEVLSIVTASTLGDRAKRIGLDEIVVFDKAKTRKFSLGSKKGATFDPTGKFIYAWTESLGTLYDVSTGNKIAEVAKGTNTDGEGAGFSANGQRIIEVCEGIRFLSVPDLKVTFEVKGGHSELHQTAHRAITIRDVGGPKSPNGYELRLALIDIDAERIIGSLPMNEAMMRVPNLAFSADGKKMSMSYAGTRVWDITTNKVIILEGGDVPAHPRYEPGPAYFSPDGNSLCVQQEGSIRAISIFNVPKGRKRHCFFVHRGQWSSEISSADIDAKIIDIPFTRGTNHPGGMWGLYYRMTSEVMNSKRDIVAVIEQGPGATKDSPLDMWLLIADANTGNLKHRVALPQMPDDVHRFEVRFMSNDKVVLVWNGDTEKAVAFDVESGAAVTVPAEFTPPDD